MSKKLTLWSITAALAGFLFGFDVVVISGADKKLQALWHTTDAFHGSVVMGMALWGTVLGAIFGGIPTNKFGRRKTLIYIGILYAIGAIGTAMAQDPYFFAIFRFLGGLGVGISTVAAPTYISEISPAEKRGRLVSLYQFNIVLGILVAFLSNYLINGTGENDWRWMLGVQAFPAIIYTFAVFTIPESPRWLLSMNREEEGRKIIKQIYPDEDSTKIFAEMHENTYNGSGDSIFSPIHRKALILAFLIAFFNQMSGINAFLYYAPRIFETAGLGTKTALLSSIGIGVTNMVFTLIGVNLIDKLGRRVLMYICSVGYIISLSLVTVAFFLHWSGITIPAFLFLFIASHAIGQGTVIWVFISEIFPNHLRASGQAFGSTTHWILAALIPSMIPWLFTVIGPGYVFLIFTVSMVFQLLFVIFLMPETKGIALENISKKLSN